jgi:drug/metabolite transporter superfamily protein YnfA
LFCFCVNEGETLDLLLDRLGHFARPILLIDSSLLLAGVLLTGSNLLLLGWSVYAIGHLFAIVALLAIGALNRRRMDAWAWAGLGVVIVGLLLALPQVAAIWSSYVQTPQRATMLVPSQTLPMGLLAELVTWIGLAFYGLAARGARALPAGVGWVFVVAAVVGLLGDFAPFAFTSALWWVPAMLVAILGLVAVGARLSPLAQRAIAEAQPSAETPTKATA